MTAPFAQFVDGMMGERPLLNQPLHLVSFLSYDLFGESY